MRRDKEKVDKHGPGCTAMNRDFAAAVLALHRRRARIIEVVQISVWQALFDELDVVGMVDG